MKNRNKALLVGLIATFSLIGCKGQPSEPVVTTYVDKTAGSIYGTIDFTGAKSPTEVVPGDVIEFKVTPANYFFISEITNNGVPCTPANEPNEDGSWTYSTTIVEGQNNIVGTYEVDPTIDFVDEYKLPLDPDIYDYVISQEETDGTTILADKKGLDFRKSGVEKCRAPLTWEGTEPEATKPIERSTDDVFINYVDGDTTHVETNNLKYTVKIRYLSIDTPESTSDIENWGLSASNYSKYIYSGREEYKKAIESTTDFTGVQAGATSIILLSQAASIYVDEIDELDDLAIGTEEEGAYHATTDGNQRNLAYVWYSTAKPDAVTGKVPQESFRCLNLEMVYQGFSFGVGSMKDTSEAIYKMFDAANLSAKANKRHLFSDYEDNNYYDYERIGEVQELELKDLYDSATKNSVIGWLPESRLADKKTLYRVHGYVSRKVGTSFYMQEKTSYTDEEVRSGQAFGIYVFTYSETPIRAGDEVSVVGALNGYGGSFQMQGIVYHDIDPDPVRDTEIISRGNTVTPVKVTGEEFNQLKLPNILVEITDNVWFYDFENTYDGEITSICEGGSEEVNKYNESYPFYNTSNSPIFYASYGDIDNARELNESSRTSSSGLRYSNKVIRFTVDQNILVAYGSETSFSYRFFTGGQYYFNEKGAEYANLNEDNPYKELTILRTFNRKASLYDPDPESETYTPHGLIVMSHGYESTTGNRKMTATICSGSVKDIALVEVED